jgi:hypothetical protein
MSNFGPAYDFGGDGDMLSGVPPMSHLFEGPTPWFMPSSDPGGGEPPFCGTPPGPSGGPVIMPYIVETPPGPNDPLDCW